jgi:hypothetical protein
MMTIRPAAANGVPGLDAEQAGQHQAGGAEQLGGGEELQERAADMGPWASRTSTGMASLTAPAKTKSAASNV